MQREKSSSYHSEIASNVWQIRDLFVNLYVVRSSIDNQWVLIDAGLKYAASKVRNLVSVLFGQNSRPAAILLTHGHFDHIGSLKTFIQEWNVQVYVHPLEVPYLTGKSEYPPPDPSVNGGLMADLSWLYPKAPIDIRNHLQTLPQDGSIPFLLDWRYIHTPGHAPGHVSFFRDKDKLLIAGDAIVTTKQESLLYVMLQKKKLSGPPKYFTYDWKASENSVKNLAKLNPNIIATGHGQPMSGDQIKKDLQNLADHFSELAIPKRGRYTAEPAIVNENGIVYLPPKKKTISLRIIIFLILLIAILVWLFFI